MRIPVAMEKRAADLERSLSSRPGLDSTRLLRHMTDAELLELRGIVAGHAPACPSCGADPKRPPHCHHHQAPLTWSQFTPEARQRIQQLDQLASARRGA